MTDDLTERLDWLEAEGAAEGLAPNPLSRRDVTDFALAIAPLKPSIFLRDNGNFSVLIDNGAGRISLEFKGGHLLTGVSIPPPIPRDAP